MNESPKKVKSIKGGKVSEQFHRSISNFAEQHNYESLFSALVYAAEKGMQVVGAAEAVICHGLSVAQSGVSSAGIVVEPPIAA